MIKIFTIVGARPQFIKASILSRLIRSDKWKKHINEVIVHTGQHYDKNMSDVFFSEMGIPEPNYNLNIGSATHGKMTGELIIKIEEILINEKPDFVLVYGDTNSTIAGALAAAKLHIPIIHVEAGLRSFNKKMPEEINRILTDHLSKILFCPTKLSIRNLKNENIVKDVYLVGDIMYDAAIFYGNRNNNYNLIEELGLEKKKYILATIHRAENTDNKQKLKNIFNAFRKISLTEKIIIPMHPRLKKSMQEIGLYNVLCSIKNIINIDPIGYIDMIELEKNSKIIITDSGGIQKEAYFHGVPCITLRDETEWIETVENGWNQVVGTDEDRIADAISNVKKGTKIDEYGDGTTAEKILNKILDYSKE